MTTRPISILDDIYKDLEKMKTKDVNSFSSVIRALIDENKLLKEENDRKDQVIERKNEVIENLSGGGKLKTKEYVSSNIRLQSDSVE